MIETCLSADLLTSLPAFISALVIGIAFGWCLEQAGFGSSRKLTAVFYFRDMAVIKVMLSAALTAVIGLVVLLNTGLLSIDSLNLPETFWLAHIIGGLMLGVGFVMGGWCPATAAVGAVSGKVDALFFLFGGVLGSILFNEAFSFLSPYHVRGAQGIRFIFSDLGITIGQFTFLLSLSSILAFWLCELIESKFDFALTAGKNKSLWAFSIAILIIATSISFVPMSKTGLNKAGQAGRQLAGLLSEIDSSKQDIEPVALARELLAGEKSIICIDLRPAPQYEEFHIPGSRNFKVTSLKQALDRYKKYDRIVLYGNDMGKTALAWAMLRLEGFDNCYLLKDGLSGLFEKVLKPASLRNTPLTKQEKQEINSWRAYFLQAVSTVGSREVQYE
jgi:rhodanese-related sulfurtransferase/uncharacterized membrane protein YedE/YeeE